MWKGDLQAGEVEMGQEEGAGVCLQVWEIAGVAGDYAEC